MIATLGIENLSLVLLIVFSLIRLANFSSSELTDEEYQDSISENQNDSIKEQKPSQENISTENERVEVTQLQQGVITNIVQQCNEVISTESVISQEVPMTFEAIQMECNDSQKNQQSTNQGQVNCFNLSSNDELQSSQNSQSRLSAQNSVQNSATQKIKKIKKQRKVSKRKAKMARLQKQIRLLS